MILENISKEVETAGKPVGKVLRKGENFHVLAIAFKKDMLLPEHKSGVPARLVVIKGEVSYSNHQASTPLGLYGEHEIPVGEPHWVEAKEDSLILVIKG